MKNYSAALKIGVSALFLWAVILPEPSHGDLRSRFGTVRTIVSEGKQNLKDQGREAKNKIKAGSKQLVTGVAIKIGAKDVTTYIYRLDALLGLESIVHILNVIEKDLTFQFYYAREDVYLGLKEDLENKIADFENKIAELRRNVEQKRQAKIAELKAAQAGNTDMQRQARAVLEEDSAFLFNIMDRIDSFTGNALSPIKSLMQAGAENQKASAQTRLTKLESTAVQLQAKLDKASSDLQRALNDPRFNKKLADLQTKKDALLTDISSLQARYQDIKNKELYEPLNLAKAEYTDQLEEFIAKSKCPNLKMADGGIAVDKMQTCKANLLKTVKKDATIKGTASCNLTPEGADLASFGKCMKDSYGIDVPLYFGRILVTQ